MALSNRVPLRWRKPAFSLRGLSKGRMTRLSREKSPSQFSLIDLPVMVKASGWGSLLCLMSSAMTAVVCQL